MDKEKQELLNDETLDKVSGGLRGVIKAPIPADSAEALKINNGHDSAEAVGIASGTLGRI